jgi:N,N'-diacetyllegionaminate synthase
MTRGTCPAEPPPAPAPERRPVTVTIGDHLIGDDRPALIIAEAGVNHDGRLDRALRLVDAAAEAGADMVKFQVFRAVELTTAGAAAAGYQQAAGASSQRAMLERLELSQSDFERIRAHCDQRGIGFLATPFGVADVERLLRLHVPAIKIASTDLNNPSLLRPAAETGLPLILSTGASTAAEIEAAVGRLRQWGAAGHLVLLHCVSGYPAPLEAANLRAIAALRQAHGVPCGFSDHTESTQIAAWAVAAGACVLEKHFTLDRSAPGPDHAMSLEPAELAAYVAAARDAELALGNGTLGMSAIESEVRSVARKSIVATTRIPAGTALAVELLTVKRPGNGIPPDQLDDVVGRLAARDIEPDTVLTWDLLR